MVQAAEVMPGDTQEKHIGQVVLSCRQQLGLTSQQTPANMLPFCGPPCHYIGQILFLLVTSCGQPKTPAALHSTDAPDHTFPQPKEYFVVSSYFKVPSSNLKNISSTFKNSRSSLCNSSKLSLSSKTFNF